MDTAIWGTIIAAASGILGTLLGAALAERAASNREKERSEREDRIRFHEKRLTAGKDFAISAVKLATGLAAGRGIKVEDVELFPANEQLINVLCGKSVRRSAAKRRSDCF